MQVWSTKGVSADNETQFVCRKVRDMCKEMGIHQFFSSVEHPQTNGQVEVANKVICRV